MATKEYQRKAFRPLTQALSKILVSLELVSPARRASEELPSVGNLLDEARRFLLPFSLAWRRHTPIHIRMLVLRQHVLVGSIMVGFSAIFFGELFGMVWVGMHLMQMMSPGSYDLTYPGPHLFAMMIASGGLMLVAKAILLCVGLAALCRPMRSKWTGE